MLRASGGSPIRGACWARASVAASVETQKAAARLVARIAILPGLIGRQGAPRGLPGQPAVATDADRGSAGALALTLAALLVPPFDYDSAILLVPIAALVAGGRSSRRLTACVSA